ncbi:hypothetical protein H9L39_10148 [Fusarium oxysporum f. sp. albedinis]|nr:hypothetical protein H9L39_10148 [Fusarium oxysporum f. sp. albedinis]
MQHARLFTIHPAHLNAECWAQQNPKGSPVQSKAKQSIATLDLSGWNDPCEESEPLRGAGD